MTYVATLAACLLGKLEPTTDFITDSGSAHGANLHFPKELNPGRADPTTHKFRPITIDTWQDWYESTQSWEKPVIAKDNWTNFGESNWEKVLKPLDCAVILSSPSTDLDWFYCWFNMLEKIPKHAYMHLMLKSKYHPKLWNKFQKKHRIMAFREAMPLYPMRENINLAGIPNFRFATTEVLDELFPWRVLDFLWSIELDAKMTKDIAEYHRNFRVRQQGNFTLAQRLSLGERWTARGPWDEILFDWLDSRLT